MKLKRVPNNKRKLVNNLFQRALQDKEHGFPYLCYMKLEKPIYCESGRDYHDRRLLLLIKDNHKGKDYYYLCGNLSNNKAFAEEMPRTVVLKARKQDRILAAQSWLYGADYTKILRQGNVGLLSEEPDKDAFEINGKMLQIENHLFVGEKVKTTRDQFWFYNCNLFHLTKKHKDIYLKGWGRMLVKFGTSIFFDEKYKRHILPEIATNKTPIYLA